MVVILPSIIIIVIISLIIITLVCICLLFTRNKKTVSLYDDVITTKAVLYTSNPSYVTNITDNDDFDGIYMDINNSYKTVLPPSVNIDENPAYGKI